MSNVYLAVRRLHVRNVNAQPTWWLVGPPGPLPYAGMAHALARSVCGNTVRESGVAVVHHDFELQAEGFPHSFAVHPHQFRGASLIDRDDYASGTQLSLQPTVRGNLVASVIVRFPPGTQLREEPVRAWLRSGRLAGGTIQGALDFTVLLSEQEARDFIRSGFAMHERSDLLQPVAGRDRLDALLAATRGDRRADLPWLMPTCLGFAALTACVQRCGARDAVPHLFAEPLVGLVQYRSVREADASLPFWRHANLTDRAFVLTTQQP
jgi:CRISPR-associated protein Csy2